MNDPSSSQFGDRELEPQLAPEQVESDPPQPEITPLPDGRYLLRLDLDLETWEDLKYVQALLGDEVPAGDVAEVLKRALRVVVDEAAKGAFVP